MNFFCNTIYINLVIDEFGAIKWYMKDQEQPWVQFPVASRATF